jgi:23S rRNA (guanosine2251-2'-O)-methyltransferase
MFATVLHNLKSPENAGIIIRTHVAFGGGPFVIVGPKPWRFKKRAQTFSRRLERICPMLHIPTDDAFFDWCDKKGFSPIAIEITEHATLLPHFKFPQNPAIIIGNESKGLPKSVLFRAQHVVTIPQFGPVECLNAAVAGCMAIYELNRDRDCELTVEGRKFLVKDPKAESTATDCDESR